MALSLKANLEVLPNGHQALENNVVYFFPLVYYDKDGNVVPAPDGDTVTAAAGGQFAGSLAVASTMDPSGNPGVSAAALVAESDAGNGGGGISIDLTGSSVPEDSKTKSALFDIVQPSGPAAAATVGLDLTNIQTSSQDTPTAPGP